jgi:hypothetical protein
MEEGIRARLTPAEGRKFAFTVGAAFLGLGLLAWYRDHASAAATLGVVGLALFLAGFTVPGRLGPARRAWMGAAHAISRVTTPLSMGLIYFLVFTPLSLIMRLSRRNVLVHPAGADGYWIRRKTEQNRRGDLEHQF